MSRRSRIVFENAIYHVIGRGNRGNDIFISDGDKDFFLKKLAFLSKEYSVEIFSYVLMRNHYHLLLRTPRANLPVFMQRMNLLYTKYFNYTHGLNGHLFQDRYKAFVVDKDRYFATVLRYIALNPVVAGMVKSAKDYEWSSYRFLFEGNKPDWLKVEEALNLIALSKPDFKFMVESRVINYNEFFKFESLPYLATDQVKRIISNISNNIGNISDNKKLLEATAYYLVNSGAKIKDIASLLSVSRKTVDRMVKRTRDQLEKGNSLYSNVLERIKNVSPVPGTNGTGGGGNGKEN
jgi:REP element-mobilizing transposase RayT